MEVIGLHADNRIKLYCGNTLPSSENHCQRQLTDYKSFVHHGFNEFGPLSVVLDDCRTFLVPLLHNCAHCRYCLLRLHRGWKVTPSSFTSTGIGFLLYLATDTLFYAALLTVSGGRGEVAMSRLRTLSRLRGLLVARQTGVRVLPFGLLSGVLSTHVHFQGVFHGPSRPRLPPGGRPRRGAMI